MMPRSRAYIYNEETFIFPEIIYLNGDSIFEAVRIFTHIYPNIFAKSSARRWV